MAYDPGIPAEGAVAGTVVMFGGLAPWGATAYTYVGLPSTVPLPDGAPTASVVWVNLTPYLQHSPSPRYYSSMTYDAHDGYLLLFGGESAGINSTLGDTWTLSVTYQGETINPPPQPPIFRFLLIGWSSTEGNHPSPRAGAALTYDSVDGYSVLFGGYNDPTFFADTWTYTAGTWTLIHPAMFPSPRAFAGFAWDQADGYALLTTGLASGPDTWGFAHGAWNPIPSPFPKGERWGQSISYDNASGNVTVFGGVNDSTMDAYQDTWNWSSPPPSWLEVDSYGPVARGGAAMAYDPQIGCSVLYGGGPSGSDWLNDTWLLCTWPLSEAPFVVTLIAHPGVSDRPEVRSGGNATFTAIASGGVFPYQFSFYLYDAPGYFAQGFGYTDSSANVTFTFPESANYFVRVQVTDNVGSTAHANLTYPVGTVMVTNWQPLRDSYNFHNFGSAWATGGNCFGFSTTMILYWQHDIHGGADTPYLPAPVWSTANLTEGAPVEPQDGPGMNGTTLAIMLHQTIVQGASSYGGGGGTDPSEFAANWASLQASLAAGQPAVLLMNAPGAGHAVVAYGYQTLPGDVFEIDVSDPNAPQTTEMGYYNASNDSFWWTGPAPNPNFDQFGVLSTPVPLTLAPSMFSKWTLGYSGAYDTQSNGYYFVAGLAPLTVSLAGGGNDTFSDGGSLADSQTFVEGIANSSGVEEPDAAGTVQAFALENLSGNTYTVTDPAAGSSPILALLATNVSGTTMVRGFNLNLTSAHPHDFSLRLGAHGTVLKVGNTSAALNISFGQLVGNASDELNASDLALPAYSVATFTVRNWSGLGSPSLPSVLVWVSPDNGSGPTTQYSLTNGQTGLGSGITVSFPVTFREVGLPSGTAWSVTVNHTTLDSTGSSVVFNETNGTYNYTAGTASEIWAAPPGSVSVTGAAASASIPFHLVTNSVTFREGGILPKTLAKSGWTVVLNGTLRHTTATSLSFMEPNGTYPLLVTGPAGIQVDERATTQQVSGATSVVVLFSKGGTSTLRFTEKGLPKGQPWCVQVNGYEQCAATAGPKYANLTPGPYNFSVLSPLRGQNISAEITGRSYLTPGGLNLSPGGGTVRLTFSYPYPVIFTDRGLTAGTWSITIKGHTEAALWNRTIAFNLTNGSFAYKVGTIAGYTAAGAPKKVTVNGAPVEVEVTFTAKPGASGAPLQSPDASRTPAAVVVASRWDERRPYR